MIKQLDQVFQENVLTEHCKNGQRYGVARHGNQRPRCVRQTMAGVLRKVTPPQQCLFQEITAIATIGWHHLKNEPLLTPDEFVSLLHHAPEEIYIFPRSIKLRSERNVETIKDFPGEKHVAGTGFGVTELVPCRVSRAIEELSVFHPSRWFRLEIRLYWPENPFHAVR